VPRCRLHRQRGPSTVPLIARRLGDAAAVAGHRAQLPRRRRSSPHRHRTDIARALALLEATGPFDMGQAAVVAGNHVLAVEAAEGTDAMLARIAELRTRGRIATPAGTGVLVKAPKSQQDRRFDLPAIGPRTVEEAARAGLAGIAVAAGAAVIADPAAVATAADAARIFVVGIDPGQAKS
jgi:DUF1009 family protein